MAAARNTTDDGAALDGSAQTLDPGDASLLALIDRLGVLLDRSDLSELAVESGATRLVLRKPVALASVVGERLDEVPPLAGPDVDPRAGS